MTRLLVSVRSVDEAVIAAANGADLIDVKEPTRGPLGRADESVAHAIAAAVAPRPVSVALGELADDCEPKPRGGTPWVFAKWGLAGLCGDWQSRWLTASRSLPPGCQAVIVAYAEGTAVAAPSVAEVVEFACQEPGGVLLIDTAEKTGRTLLDWLEIAEIADIIRECRDADVRVALAGSLDVDACQRLLPLGPDWLAVRGAVCVGGRAGMIDATLVRTLSGMITSG